MTAQRPTYSSVRTTVLFLVGVGLAIYNSVIGDHNFPTFIVALMFCGFPFVINLDEIIKKTPIAVAPPPGQPDEEAK